MLAKIQSCAVIGLEGAIVEVEVDLSNGLAAFTQSFHKQILMLSGPPYLKFYKLSP